MEIFGKVSRDIDFVRCAMKRKLKVIRVVTTSECVPWHMGNTLTRITKDFDVCIVGEGVSVYKNAYPNVDWVDISINRKISPLSDLITIYNLCKLFHGYKPDIVHSIMPKAGLLTAISSFICRVPLRVHTFTGQVWATKVGISRFFFRVLDKLIVKLNSVCLTDSPSQSNFLYEQSISFNGMPLQVLLKGSLSGVDISRFSKLRVEKESRVLRTELGIAKSDFVFAFIARKSFDKGAFDIINAFSRIVKSHANVKLLFIGPDESDGGVEKLIKTYPLVEQSIFNIGKVSNHEVYLAITNVLCLPSYREGFGSIVIDAAAMGVPTIGSRIPGLADSIIDKQTGMLFTKGNIDELVSQMQFFVENPEMCKKMGECAKSRVDEFFTADRLYIALKELYLSFSKGNLEF
ncbi:MAG: glycosyltransferase [Methylococcales bacterium]|nr:glycosyltransferase [Methylococcales bacterium]